MEILYSSNNSFKNIYEFIRGKINYCRTDLSHTKNCIYDKVNIFANSQKLVSHMIENELKLWSKFFITTLDSSSKIIILCYTIFAGSILVVFKYLKQAIFLQ